MDLRHDLLTPKPDAMNIQTPAQFGKALSQPYAWPGGYPLFFITSDGAALCFKCAKKEGRRITDSIRTNCRDGWKVEAVDVNWEDTECFCDHCSQPIESAYGENKATA